MSLTDSNHLSSSNSSPRISWLMCAHVQNGYLEAAIKSCLSQSYQDFELIIVINGPQRDEIERAINTWFPSHIKIHLYKTEIQHLIFSLNLGLNVSRGQYIARMDSDDISTSCRLMRQIEYMDSHSEISVLGTAYKVIDEDGALVGLVHNPLSNHSIRNALYFRNPINHPSVMVRKSAIVNVGGYMGGIHAEDYDLWCRLSLDKNIQFANLSEYYLSYRIFGAGSARKSRRAYATQAGTQMNMFLLTLNPIWILSVLVSVGKAIFLSKRS